MEYNPSYSDLSRSLSFDIILVKALSPYRYNPASYPIW